MRHGSSTLDPTAARQQDLLRGLGLRLGLPAFVVKYGGSALWKAMVFFLVALAGSRLSRPGFVRISAAIAIIVEAGPYAGARRLSAGRRAAAGPHLLGLEHAYGVEIIVAMGLDRFAAWRSSNNACVSFPSNR